MVLTRTDLSEIEALVKEATQSAFNKDFLEQITKEVVKVVSEKFMKIIEDHQATIEKMSHTINDLKLKYEVLENNMDRNEQLMKRKNIRISGIPENGVENVKEATLNLLNSKMKLNIKENDIEDCYRIKAKHENNKRRPNVIFLRFADMKCCTLVKNNKSKLKSTGIYINEDLTKFRLNLLNTAIETFSLKNAWSNNGTIFVKCNNKVHMVRCEKDITKLR